MDSNLALIRSVDAGEDVHQCGLPSTVLSEYGVDRSAGDRQVGTSIRQNPWKSLPDIRQSNRRDRF